MKENIYHNIFGDHVYNPAHETNQSHGGRDIESTTWVEMIEDYIEET